MATQLYYNLLSKQQIDIIAKECILKPKSSFYGRQFAAEPETVSFFEFSKDQKENKVISLPCAFASCLVGKHVNMTMEKKSVKFKFTATWRDRQEPAYLEGLRQLTTKGATILRLPPGFGKTVLGVGLASQLGLLTLVVYHQVTLEQIWINSFLAFSDAKIAVFSSDSKIARKYPLTDSTQVILSMISQVPTIPSDYRYGKIGTLILDEAHLLCTGSRVPSLLSVTPHYIIAETATLKRPDGMENMIYLMCGLNSVELHNDKNFTVTRVNTRIPVDIDPNLQGGEKWRAITNFLTENKQRNEMILNIILSRPTHKFLVLCRSKQHVTNLYNMLQDCKCRVDFMMGNKKGYEDSQVLLGTISKIGTGFDEKAFCKSYNGVRIDHLIITTSIKEIATLEQNVGRVLRADVPHVFHLYDEHPIIKRHWSGAHKWYESNCGTVTIENFTTQRVPVKLVISAASQTSTSGAVPAASTGQSQIILRVADIKNTTNNCVK
jgi:superfamily II DNA or RNA helicase